MYPGTDTVEYIPKMDGKRGYGKNARSGDTYIFSGTVYGS